MLILRRSHISDLSSRIHLSTRPITDV